MTSGLSAASVPVDTSVAIPLLVETHTSHRSVTHRATDKTLVLSGHAVAETYSVLKRLPGSARVEGADAVKLMDHRFAIPLVLPERVARDVHRELAGLQIAGGVVYDALVAFAARAHGLALAGGSCSASHTTSAAKSSRLNDVIRRYGIVPSWVSPSSGLKPTTVSVPLPPL